MPEPVATPRDVSAGVESTEAPLDLHALRDLYDRGLYPRLSRFALVLGGIVSMFTLSHFFLQPPERIRVLVPVDGTTALVHITIFVLLRRGVIGPSRTHAALGAMVTIQTLNTAFEFTQSNDPILGTYFMVIGLAVGLLTFSWAWFIGLLAVVVSSWAACAAWAGWPPEMQRFSLGVVVFAVFSTMMFAIRRSSFIRERRLRASDALKARQLAAERDRADAANRAKSQFLANMSHELRTPLNAILGYSEMLREDAEDAGRTQDAEDLRKIDSAGRHLLRLIGDLLDLAKIEAGGMKIERVPLSLRALCEEVMTTIQPLAQKHGTGLEFRFELAPARDEVQSDPTRLRQCLLNLLSNACKFTKGGTVTLHVCDGDASDSRAAPMIELRVIDTGIGMTPEQCAAVFQRFVQAEASTTRKYGGTGIGLPISKQLARLLGGDITVRSVLGEGSTFTLTIPERAPAGASADA